MRVAWLTPFGRQSDIGAFSRNLLRSAQASGRFDYSLLVNRCGDTYFWDGKQIDLSESTSTDLLDLFDVAVFNLGNNCRNHRHINRLALGYPGIVVVHDRVMQHYMAEAIFEERREPAVYADLLCAYYGAEGAATLAGSRICAISGLPRYAPWDSGAAIEMPLLEPFLASAAAVVVHSEFAEAVVRKLHSGPILRLALPHDQKPTLTAQDLAAWHSSMSLRRPLNVTAFGHVGRNKCLDILLQAPIACPELRSLVRLNIAGYAEDQGLVNELRDIVRAADLGDLVNFEFNVDASRLQQLKSDTDIFVNLRWPNTEAASGSLVEQLNTGKPVVVYASGCYAEVPVDAALRVEQVNSPWALGAVLLHAVRNRHECIAIGERGQAWVRRIGAREYIARFEEFAIEHRTLLAHRREARPGRPVLCLRPVDSAQIAEDGWTRQLGLAREVTAFLVGDAPLVTIRPFVSFPPDVLESFVLLGLFRLRHAGENDVLRACLRGHIDHGDRLTLFRAVRQALLVLRLIGAQSGPVSGEVGAPCREAMELLGAFGTDAVAGAAYVLVLRRVPAPGEAAGYAARLDAGEPVPAILREMMNSAEFAALPSGLEEELTDGAVLAEAMLRASMTDPPWLDAGVRVPLSHEDDPPAGAPPR